MERCEINVIEGLTRRTLLCHPHLFRTGQGGLYTTTHLMAADDDIGNSKMVDGIS